MNNPRDHGDDSASGVDLAESAGIRMRQRLALARCLMRGPALILLDEPYAALYVRGLINLMGLHRPKAAERDFSGYLAVAPFGSHRTAAVTLLALAHSQDHR